VSRQGALEDERGFTLIEAVIVIVLMGIVLAIASSSWFGTVESRRVDSAANQLAADLRQAHTRAINELVQQTVTLTDGSSEYTVTGVANNPDLDDDPDEDLVVVDASSATIVIVFEGNGEAQVTGDNSFEVRSTDDINKKHTIDVNTPTSRIQIDPPTP
jgi:prepilin-type N-terminal cleavage/methylation domain-containing protein